MRVIAARNEPAPVSLVLVTAATSAGRMPSSESSESKAERSVTLAGGIAAIGIVRDAHPAAIEAPKTMRTGPANKWRSRSKRPSMVPSPNSEIGRPPRRPSRDIIQYRGALRQAAAREKRGGSELI